MEVIDFNSFIDYCNKYIKGDEKGEAQLFLDHFFNALGYTDGLKGAGANCEFRIRDDNKGTTQFADLVWKPIVLIEMKKRGVDLSLHYQQAFDYWFKLVPNRPNYVILCNFDEFWIYDLNKQVYEPLEKIDISTLPERHEVFSFLLPIPRKPLFKYNIENVTEKAAYCISHVYNSLKTRGINAEIALRYCLQMVLALFAEDVELLPNQIFTHIINELEEEKVIDGNSGARIPIKRSYDLIGGLFKEMNAAGIADGGLYEGVEYFNGGLFDKIFPIELTKWEIDQIKTATIQNWRNVNPSIFGSIFESALDNIERHKLGAHYTHEIDIKKIVVPVIVRPWSEKIDNAKNLDELYVLLNEIANYKVLDPACGSGNFLFVAFKELKMLEKRILQAIREKSTKRADAKRLVKFLLEYKYVSTNQFYGIDINSFSVELAKVTLMIAKELTWVESKESHDNKSKPLPLDNLDQNIICSDALIYDDGSKVVWPQVDAIIGNPPFQSKNKIKVEFGIAYVNKLRSAYPDIPGRADFCVYWFYKAHQNLKQDGFAGLVGTNTIRQNFSREGSLDYIVKNGGVIIDAVSSQDWSGEAAVFVSIVNWKKGKSEDDKLLWFYDEKKILNSHVTNFINSSLSLKTDVSNAIVLLANTKPKKVFQGQTHGHEGFLVSKSEALQILAKHHDYSNVLKPFLNGDELVANYKSQPDRFVIDFTLFDSIDATKYKEVYKIVESLVLPEREKKAKEQLRDNQQALKDNPHAKVNKHHINFFNKWWQLSYGRTDMLRAISKLRRYIACSRVTQRPIFEFISSDINPNDKLMCFAFEDDYSFGIIQSNLHWIWFLEKCTTNAETPNYNSEAIWDTFPWPQNLSDIQIEKIALASRTLRNSRNEYMQKNRISLRELYRTLEKPGKNKLKDLHAELDKAVLEAYGFIMDSDLLEKLLNLNFELSERESNGEEIQGPGIPKSYKYESKLLSDDCIRFEPKPK
jgi:hypothetical protein